MVSSAHLPPAISMPPTQYFPPEPDIRFKESPIGAIIFMIGLLLFVGATLSLWCLIPAFLSLAIAAFLLHRPE